MKNISLIVWMTQLGLNVALPPAGFILLGSYVKNRFSLGNWVIWVAVALGLVCAIHGLISSLAKMQKMAQQDEEEKPPVAFNDHE